MKILQFIIRRKTLISMLFIGMTLLGYVSYRNLPVELFPNAELPLLILQVNTQVEVDPGYMENQGIIPLEGAVSTLEGIEKIESFAEQRRGIIVVYYTQSTNIKYAYLKLQEKVNIVKSSLPEEFSVNVVRVDTEQLANMFMGLQVRGGGGLDRVRTIVDQKIVPELENIDGIASVDVLGGHQKSLEIILHEDACQAYGVTPVQIRTLIRNNSQLKTFLGQVHERNRRVFVNLTAEFQEITDLENIVVRPAGPVLLKDVADIYFGLKEQTTLSRVNGKDAVTLQLIRDAQVNLIELSHTAKAVIQKLNSQMRSSDIEVVIQSNVAEDMESNINLIIQLALIGASLAVVILWIFLRNVRLVITITLAIPISVFTAFNLFYAFGISINSLTLVGMALALGMLLDNSIVVLENIYRLISQKRSRDTAVIQGTKEVWRSIVAATLTTIAVFLPFLFSSNFMVKIIGHHIGVAIISTLLVSLVVALLLIPMVTHFFLKRDLYKKGPIFKTVSQKNRLIQIYTLLLKSCLRYPARTIIGAVVLFFVSAVICLALSLNVLREVESEEFNLYVTMPRGSTLESTGEVVFELEERLGSIEEREDIISKIYEEEAILTITLHEDYQKTGNRTLAQIKDDIQSRINNFEAAEVDFQQPQSSSRFRGGGRSNPGAGFQRMLGIGSQIESVVIKGGDFELIRNVAEDVQYVLEELSSIENVGVNISDNRPEIHIYFDPYLLSQYSISLQGITSELSTFRNEFSSGLTLRQGTEEYDIIIRNEKANSNNDKTIDDLQNLSVPAMSGISHDLSQLSRIIYASGIANITRVNQEKQIEVSYRFLQEVNDSKTFLKASREEVDDVIAALTIPAGVAMEVIHDETDLSEYYFLIGAAVLLIYMILASVFQSMSTPVVMMFSIPLAAIGSFWALILTGNSLLNANTLTGFLILLGVVVNNGIIFIDYTRILRRQGCRRSRALLMAGQARIRPILITAITTIVAMLPLALGKAEYVTQIGAPFAITVIGGLALSTLFTLVFIPTLYSGLESALAWIRDLSWKIKVLELILVLAGCWLI
jgi:multidrug efflux pump subunit AcrB